MSGDGDTPPLLKVVNQDATPEEVAALVAVFAALEPAGDGGAGLRRTPEWSRPARMHRPAYPHGPGGWRSSSLAR